MWHGPHELTRGPASSRLRSRSRKAGFLPNVPKQGKQCKIQNLKGPKHFVEPYKFHIPQFPRAQGCFCDLGGKQVPGTALSIWPLLLNFISFHIFSLPIPSLIHSTKETRYIRPGGPGICNPQVRKEKWRRVAPLQIITPKNASILQYPLLRLRKKIIVHRK